jgi:FimV-like protein
VWDLRKKKPDTSIDVRHLPRIFTWVILVFLGCAWASSWAATDSYTTQPGDTLWEIATRHREDAAISPQQMMLALFRANPGAFVDTNIHRLKTGVVLRIPAREELLTTRFEEAVTEVAQQNALWHRNRARLEGLTTHNESVAVVSPAQPLAAPDKPLEQGATETFADNEVLRTRIATLEEKLAMLDGIITGQHNQLAELQQRLAKSQEHTSTQTAAGREDVASAVPGEKALPTAVMTTPAMGERPQVGSRIAVGLADPKIVMAVGGVALLGLAVMWLRVRCMTAHKATAEVAPAAAVRTPAAPPVAVEDDAFVFASRDLEVGGEAAPETALANLMLDVDDLDLEGDQGREEGTGDGAALPRLSNTASSSRKAGEALP